MSVVTSRIRGLPEKFAEELVPSAALGLRASLGVDTVSIM